MHSTDKNNINELDELLNISWMENMLQGDHDKDFFARKVTNAVPEERRKEMIDKLYSGLKQPSFGELLNQSLAEANEERVLSNTKLSGEMLNELKTDSLAVNNVPVRLLKNLLQELKISFGSAKEAILKTFDLLQLRQAINPESPFMRPVFRKGMADAAGESFKRVPNKDLFENEYSLNQYLNHLEKLME